MNNIYRFTIDVLTLRCMISCYSYHLMIKLISKCPDQIMRLIVIIVLYRWGLKIHHQHFEKIWCSRDIRDTLPDRLYFVKSLNNKCVLMSYHEEEEFLPNILCDKECASSKMKSHRTHQLQNFKVSVHLTKYFNR